MTAAASLITEERCSAGCLLAAARSRRQCRCKCRGDLHSLLSGADVSSLIEGRHLAQLTDLEVLMTA